MPVTNLQLWNQTFHLLTNKSISQEVRENEDYYVHFYIQLQNTCFA